MKNVFITGANRGIGLELVKQCLDMKHEVVATHRKNSDIKKLLSLSEENPNLKVMEMDVNSCSSVHSLFSRLNASRTKIDLLFNNAGILDWSPMEKIQIDSMQQIYETNVIGPLRVIKESTDCLKRSQDLSVFKQSRDRFTPKDRLSSRPETHKTKAVLKATTSL